MRKLLVGLAVLAPFFFSGCDSSTGPGAEDLAVDTVSIGVIMPITGTGPLQHDSEQAAIQLALADVNAYLAERTPRKWIEADIRDSMYDPGEIQGALEDLDEAGIRVVVFSGTSTGLTSAQSYASGNGMLLINQSSTATSLSTPDNIFRLAPDDEALSGVLSEVLTSRGHTALAILNRGDVWGSGLAQGIGEAFGDAGGSVLGTVIYDPRFISVDLETALDDLDHLVGGALAGKSPEEIAVSFVTYEEGVDLLELASGYPNLDKVKWYGSDGFVQNQALLENTVALDFAEIVGAYSPVIGEPTTAGYAQLQGEIAEATGYTPYSLALLLYDAFFLAALTRADEGYSDDIDALKSVFLSVLSGYDAVSGTIELNENGDRANPTYDFWGISPGEGWRLMFTAPEG